MNERTKTIMTYLSEIGKYLIELDNRLTEFQPSASDTVDTFIDGILNAPQIPLSRNPVVLQQNKSFKEKEHGIDKIFTKKEITEMPKLKDLSYRYRPEMNIHEFRYRKNGINKSFSSVKFKIAKEKALDFVRELNAQEMDYTDKSIRFANFAENYLQTVKRYNVTPKTFKNEYNRYQNYILPRFKMFRVREIKAPLIQRFLNSVVETGHFRTAEACFYILKMIFEYAVNCELINRNPVLAVQIPMHQRNTGTALTIEDEKAFIKNLDGTIYKTRILVLLYTGCRPCELPTAELKHDGFITFRNLKQKHGAVEYKDIPITPMLAPYIEDIKKELPFTYPDRMKKTCAEKLKKYRVYDLRHTFATRCQECGVPQEVVGRWLGHKSGKITDNTYTHFTPAFMLEQAKKVDY